MRILYVLIVIFGFVTLTCATEKIRSEAMTNEVVIKNLIPSENLSKRVMPYKQEEYTKIKVKSTQKLSNILLKIPFDVLKNYIFANLSSKNLLTLYKYFQSEEGYSLDLEKLLREHASNLVVDLTSKENELKILFNFQKDYPILYSKRTKNAEIISFQYSEISSTLTLGLIQTWYKILIPFSQIMVDNDTIFLCATYQKYFCICDKNCKILAEGHSFQLDFVNFDKLQNPTNLWPEYKLWLSMTVWEIIHLKGVKKIFLYFRHYLTSPYKNYIKFICPVLDILNNFATNLLNEQNDDMTINPNFMLCYLCKVMFFVVVTIIGAYFYYAIAFHLITLPFHASSFLIAKFVMKHDYFSFFSFLSIHASLFLLYSLTLPRYFDDFYKHVFYSYGRRVENGSLTQYLNNADISPRKTMWPFLFLIPRKRSFKFYIYFIMIELFLSILLKVFFEKWYPLQGENM